MPILFRDGTANFGTFIEGVVWIREWKDTWKHALVKSKQHDVHEKIHRMETLSGESDIHIAHVYNRQRLPDAPCKQVMPTIRTVFFLATHTHTHTHTHSTEV